MKVSDLKKLLEYCEDDWDICYAINADPYETVVIDIEELNEDKDFPRTYILF